MAGSAASIGCSAIAAVPRSITSSRTARVSTSSPMQRASAPSRARWRALPNSKQRSRGYAPSGGLQSSSSPPIPRRARMRAGPGGMSWFPRYLTGPRSLPPAPHMTPRELTNGLSAYYPDLPIMPADQPARRRPAFGMRCRTLRNRPARSRSHRLADAMGRDRAVFEDPQISGNGVYDIKDLAPHRLQLRDPSTQAGAGESQMFRPQSDSHCTGRTLERKHDRPDAHNPVPRLAADHVDRRRPDEASDEQALRPAVEVVRWADLLDPAGTQTDDAVGHRRRLDLVVGNEDRRHPELFLQ